MSLYEIKLCPECSGKMVATTGGWSCPRTPFHPKSAPSAPKTELREPGGLEWTTEKPKAPGLYLSRCLGDDDPREWGVFWVPKEGAWLMPLHPEYAGPIPEPRTARSAPNPPGEGPNPIPSEGAGKETAE